MSALRIQWWRLYIISSVINCRVNYSQRREFSILILLKRLALELTGFLTRLKEEKNRFNELKCFLRFFLYLYTIAKFNRVKIAIILRHNCEARVAETVSRKYPSSRDLLGDQESCRTHLLQRNKCDTVLHNNLFLILQIDIFTYLRRDPLCGD